MSSSTETLESVVQEGHPQAEGGLRFSDVFEMRKYHFPRDITRFVTDFSDVPHGPDDCRVVMGSEVRAFGFQGPQRWTPWETIQKAFDQHQVKSHNQPYPWEWITQPVNLVISYSIKPVHATLTFQRVFPQHGILGLLRPEQSLEMAYAAVGVLNSALGLNAYHHLTTAHEIKLSDLNRLLVAPKGCRSEDLARVSRTSYQLHTVIEAQSETHRLFPSVESELADRLQGAVTAFWRLTEPETEQGFRAARKWNAWGLHDHLQEGFFTYSTDDLKYRITLLSDEERNQLASLRKQVTKGALDDNETVALRELSRIEGYEERLNAAPPSEERVALSSPSKPDEPLNNGVKALERIHEVGRIWRFPGVQGGDACIAGTRIPVWTLAQMARAGYNDADLLAAYPALRAIDLQAGRVYMQDHQQEIDTRIRQNEAP